MSKKTAAEVEHLRTKLGDLTELISAATVEVEKAADKGKKKKVAAAVAEVEALGKKRKKAWEALEALQPGLWTPEGWAVEVKPAKAKKAATIPDVAKAITDAVAKPKKAAKTAAEKVEALPEPVEPDLADEAREVRKAAAEDVTATAEWKAAGERHLEHLTRVEELQTRRADLTAYLADPSHKKKARKAAEGSLAATEAELERLRVATEERAKEVAHVTTGRNLKIEPAETDEQIKARVQAKRAAREAETINGRTEPEVEAWLDKDDPAAVELTPKKTKAKKAAKPAAKVEVTDTAEPAEALTIATQEKVNHLEAPGDGPTVEDVEPVVRRDRWDRPIILAPDGEERGYRRMTTFIDALEDKTTLVDWKQRVVVVGVAAIEQKAAGGDGIPEVMGIDEVGAESVLARVEASNVQFAAAMKTLRKDLRKGKIEPKAFDDAAAQVEKAQKAELNSLVSEAFKAGDGFLKAEAGTRLHYLMECVDKGEPLPEDTTDLERRDIAAVLNAYEQLNAKILDVERFIVRDDLEAAGTLDRRLTYDSPALGRRVIAIGDLKTGRMDFGAAKMARQLAGYAGGKGWNPAKPEARDNLRCNREVGLIFHIPSGSGVCTVYELDLKTGDRGLKLCAEVYKYRSETSTLTKVTAQGDGSPKAGLPVAVADMTAEEA